MKKMLYLVLLTSLLLVVGCSKDDKDNEGSNPTGPTVADDAPTYKTLKVDIPESMKNSNDEHVQMVVGYTTLANLFSASINNYFVPPSLNKAMGDGPWQHAWKRGELNVSVLIQKLADRHTWEVTYTGRDDEHVYQNFVAFRAEQALDERSGAFYMYDPKTELVMGQFTWFFDENEALHFEVSADQYIKDVKFVGRVNTDRSGVLELFSTLGTTDVLQKKYQWDSSGAGEWWEYDAAGNLVNSGTWM